MVAMLGATEVEGKKIKTLKMENLHKKNQIKLERTKKGGAEL